MGLGECLTVPTVCFSSAAARGINGIRQVGFIEVVPGCTALGKVQGYSLSGAFQRSAITDWLLAQSASKAPVLGAEVKENYVSTLAASCVFEYVLGLGDRHCDNILLSPTGQVFHIDFGMVSRRQCRVS